MIQTKISRWFPRHEIKNNDDFYNKFVKIYYLPDVARRNWLVAIKQLLPRGWRVTLKVRPFGTVYGWSNILHVTIGGNAARYVDRIQAIWLLNPGSSKLRICSAANGNKNYWYSTPYQIGRYKFTTIACSDQATQRSSFNKSKTYITVTITSTKLSSTTKQL